MRNGLFRKRDGTGFTARWNGSSWDFPPSLDIPGEDDIRAWIVGDEDCSTPTGYIVEPDGVGPDGCPSWLLLLSYL